MNGCTEGVHRVIAKAFIQNPKNKPHVNHINAIKDDNRVENLEWVTRLENIDHAVKIGVSRAKGDRGIINLERSKIDLLIKESYDNNIQFENIGSIINFAEKHNVTAYSVRQIIQIKNKKLWK